MIRDLEYPDDARRVIDSLQAGLRYDAALAVLGLSAAKCTLSGSASDLSTGIRYGGREEDEAVRREAPGLFARFSLISMVSRVERHTQLLLLQRRVLEYLGDPSKKMDPAGMWSILRSVHTESRAAGPRKMCSELVVTGPSVSLLDRLKWFDGLVRVRNCLAHRLGIVQIEDVKPFGVSLEDTKDDDTLNAVWLRIKPSVNGKEIKSFPHIGGGNITIDFEEYEREWKIGDPIHMTPLECQGIAMSLSLLGNQLLAEFETEINELFGLSRPSQPPC